MIAVVSVVIILNVVLVLVVWYVYKEKYYCQFGVFSSNPCIFLMVMLVVLVLVYVLEH